ncbi:MAG: flagellar hook-basal body complex protein [Sulfurimonas sp.]
MMTQAFYTGLTGLKASSQAIDVISDNLANTSTIGFRGYTTEFSSMFEEAINTNSVGSSIQSSIGVGSRVNSIVMDQSQGVLQLTQSGNDLAILGDGWFGTQANAQTFYTRDGNFTFDANRDLVTQDGMYVLGTMGNNITNGVLSEQLFEIPLTDVGQQESLAFPQELYFPPTPTSQATFSGNLNLDQDVSAVGVPIISSDGSTNNLRLEFTKSALQVPPGVQWDVVATTQNRDGSVVYDTQTGIVSFDESGALISNTLSSIDNQGTSVSINLGTGFDGMISISAANSLVSQADGFEAGELLGYDINKNGDVLATFTNGRQSNVGKIGIFHFQNDQGLDRISGSRFAASENSGAALFFQDANGNNINGTDLATFKLEGSNVRLEVGLTDIIIMQRAYDANSKSISTADQMLQKALSMDA